MDDWGTACLTDEQRRDLFEVIEDRYDRGSTLITSQVPLDNWHQVIGDPTLADAILDQQPIATTTIGTFRQRP